MFRTQSLRCNAVDTQRNVLKEALGGKELSLRNILGDVETTRQAEIFISQYTSEDSQKSTFSNRNFNHVNKFQIHEKRNMSNFCITGLSEESQRINF